MKIRKLFIIMFLIAAGVLQSAFAQQQPPALAQMISNEYVLSSQLSINRDALLMGSTEKMRIDAASVMMADDDEETRKVLLECFQPFVNIDTRVAICKAISQYRIIGIDLIKNRKDFIAPLIDMLIKEKPEAAVYASEAILVYEYKQIGQQLESKVSDKKLPLAARLNIIRTLKLEPDMRAINKLLDLVDDTDFYISENASEALVYLGIPVGNSPKDRKIIKKNLEQRGKDLFLIDRIKRIDDQKRKLEEDRNLWQQKYLLASDRIYKNITDDQARGKFLVTEYLTSNDDSLKLWALGKVEEWLKGTNPQVPATISEQLIKFISDGNKDVRSKTASLLPFMGDLNCAQALADQIKVEKIDRVKLELFAALGFACRTGTSEELKKQALDWAVDFLSSRYAYKVKTGADVLKKLVEQNCLADAEVGKYLSILAKRYTQEKKDSDVELRTYLLDIMAKICNLAWYHDKAAENYRALFEQGLNDKADKIREAAVEGLIAIDEKRALQNLRPLFASDTSQVIRKRLIDLAGKVGVQDDLQWLVERTDAERDYAWSAIIKILGDSDAQALAKWLGYFEKAPQGFITDQQMTALLEKSEKKADAAKMADFVNACRLRLAELYNKTGNYQKAAEYLGTLIKTADINQKDKLTGDLVNTYLRGLNFEAVGSLVTNQLLNNDLQIDNCMVVSIDKYLAEPNKTSDPNLVISALAKVTGDIKDRPIWQKQLSQWQKQYCDRQKAKKP